MKISGPQYGILVTLCLMFLLSGCPAGAPEEPPQVPVEVPVPAPAPVEVSDREIIQDLWDTLLYDSILSLGNGASFSEPGELDTGDLARFSYYKVLRNSGTEALEPAPEGSGWIIRPGLVEQVAGDYFVKNSFRLQPETSYDYDSILQGFVFYSQPDMPVPPFDSLNPWGIHFESLYDLGDDLFEASLIRHVDMAGQYIETRWVYRVLRDGDSWKFVSLDKQHPENHLVRFEGNVTVLPVDSGLPRPSGETHLILLGENQMGQWILAGKTWGSEPAISFLGLVDPGTLRVKKSLNPGVKDGEVSWWNGKVLLKGNEEVQILNGDLEVEERISLPEEIRRLMDRRETRPAIEPPRIWFGGYDLIPEPLTFCYSDEEGLKLYRPSDGLTRLLSATPQYPEDDMYPHGYFDMPRFVAGGRQVFAGVAGYEGFRDYLLVPADGSKPGRVLKIGRYPVVSLSVASGRILAADREEAVLLGPEPEKSSDLMGDWPLEGYPELQGLGLRYGDGFIPFLLTEPGERKTLIYIADTGEGSIRGPVCTVSMAQVSLTGVLEDGRILLAYSLYPNEYGYALVSP